MDRRIKHISSLLAVSLLFSCTQSVMAVTQNQGLGASEASQLKLLELKYFEHNFNSDSAEERVARLENLIFGETESGSPADRVNKLVSTLLADGETLDPIGSSQADAGPSHLNPSRSNQTVQQGDDDDDDSSQSPKPRQTSAASNKPSSSNSYSNPGNYPHINNLEKEILGATYESQTLPARLSRLETKAFGSPTDSGNFSARTDRLEDYAVRVLHNKPFAVNPDIDKTYVIPARRSYSMQSQGFSQLPLQHFFSPTRMSPDFAAAENEIANQTPQVQTIADDPIVLQKDPPPAGTRMITQVGWCEMQLFGHTCPNMHLSDRLRQLNDNTHAVSGKQSDMQLMDDLSPIIKVVLSRRSSGGGNISSKNSIPTR